MSLCSLIFFSVSNLLLVNFLFPVFYFSSLEVPFRYFLYLLFHFHFIHVFFFHLQVYLKYFLKNCLKVFVYFFLHPYWIFYSLIFLLVIDHVFLFLCMSSKFFLGA